MSTSIFDPHDRHHKRCRSFVEVDQNDEVEIQKLVLRAKFRVLLSKLSFIFDVDVKETCTSGESTHLLS